MIEGVLINKLKQIPDERGAIYHMLRRDNDHFIEFGEIYFFYCLSRNNKRLARTY